MYNASKFAVDALTKAFRMDFLPYGIRVTSINPGMVETEFSLVRFDGDAQAAKNVYKGLQPLSAADIADTIWFVVSRPSHVNIGDIYITPTRITSYNVCYTKLLRTYLQKAEVVKYGR